MTTKPKPFVTVSKTKDGWDWDCDRCHQHGWDRTWSATLARANRHNRSHQGIGFSPKGR